MYIFFVAAKMKRERKRKDRPRQRVSVLKNIRVYNQERRYRTANEQPNTECVYEKK